MTLSENKNRKQISFSELRQLDHEIIRFDCILEKIQEALTDDLRVYEAVVSARDYIFRMREVLHGCDIVRFCGGGGGTS